MHGFHIKFGHKTQPQNSSKRNNITTKVFKVEEEKMNTLRLFGMSLRSN